MKISPIVKTSFNGSFDIGREIKDAISKKLSGTINNPDSDEFVPSAPSQPIMITKLEINQGEKGAKAALKNGGLAAGGAVTGYGAGDLITKKDASISSIFNGDDEVSSSETEIDDDGTDIAHIGGGDDDVFGEADDGGDDFDDGDDMDD